MEHNSVFKIVKMIMALPFMPHELIPNAYDEIRKKAKDHLKELMDYVYKTWITNSVWPPKCWSVFMQGTRTNNDVEGWHRRLNAKAGRGLLQFYILVELLETEAKMVSLQAKLVSERKLRKLRRKKYSKVQTQLFALWQKFTDGQLTAGELLQRSSMLTGPVIT